MLRVMLLVAASVLAACGGGYDEPEKTAQPRMRLDGNSVMWGATRSNDTAPWRKSPNAVIFAVQAQGYAVTDYSVNGSTAYDLLRGPNWPPSTCDAVHVVLHGHNEGLQIRTDLEPNLHRIVQESCAERVVLVTPNATPSSFISAQANIVRKVAQESRAELCDIEPIVPPAPDGLHPDDAGYGVLSTAVLACVLQGEQPPSTRPCIYEPDSDSCTWR